MIFFIFFISCYDILFIIHVMWGVTWDIIKGGEKKKKNKLPKPEKVAVMLYS